MITEKQRKRIEAESDEILHMGGSKMSFLMGAEALSRIQNEDEIFWEKEANAFIERCANYREIVEEMVRWINEHGCNDFEKAARKKIIARAQELIGKKSSA